MTAGPITPRAGVAPSTEVSVEVSADRRSRARSRLVWAIQISAAIICGTAGALKLAGHPAMVAIFEQIGAGQWLRQAVGGVELGGAILLLNTRTAALGALVLGGVMGGAIAVQLAVLRALPYAAIAVLAMLGTIVVERGERLERMVSRLRPRGNSSPHG